MGRPRNRSTFNMSKSMSKLQTPENETLDSTQSLVVKKFDIELLDWLR